MAPKTALGAADAAPAQVLVVGEALIDVVHRQDGTVDEHPGGSPANVAITLGRLGRPVDGNAAMSCSSDVTACFFTNWANSVLFLARRLVPSTQRGAPAHEMHADTYTTQRGSHHVPSRYQR